MYWNFKSIVCCLLVACSVMTACKKEDNPAPDTTTTPPTPDPDPEPADPVDTPGFFYAENGATTFIPADDAWVNEEYNTIIAQNEGSTICEINLTALTESEYTLSSGNALTYIKSGAFYASDGGKVTITKNAGGKLSGTFTSTGTGISGVTSVSGKFIDIPLK